MAETPSKPPARETLLQVCDLARRSAGHAQTWSMTLTGKLDPGPVLPDGTTRLQLEAAHARQVQAELWEAAPLLLSAYDALALSRTMPYVASWFPWGRSATEAAIAAASLLSTALQRAVQGQSLDPPNAPPVITEELWHELGREIGFETAHAIERLKCPPAKVVEHARHGPGFRSVWWFGTLYSFTAAQGAAVALLWPAWLNGTPDVSGDEILESIGSEGKRLEYLFRDHPAWGTMIVPGGSKGAHRLQAPA